MTPEPLLIPNDLVMGVHWTPPAEYEGAGFAPPNLDAVCIMLDSHGRRLEVIHPGHLRNANGSVVHTGDSRTGASTWDDERIFIFTAALPEEIYSLVLGVVSHGRPFSEVAGARCHLSDRATEDELLRVDLTSRGSVKEYCLGSLQRGSQGWLLRQQTRLDTSLSAAL